jgi:L-ascorbate metabolism protein UlaG (beta-lactamase superfamily)
MALELEYLNHASMLLGIADVSLLSDPWFEGSAFSGGWGLRYDNPDALEHALAATHLWISHWHSDHLHVPTLQKLAQKKPSIVVLANESVNFSMVQRLTELGFRTVIPLRERESVRLSTHVTVTRYPTAGIDNMLHIAGGGFSVLNYNDCNLPARAVELLLRHIGPVDLLLTNYNHAGKLLEPLHDAAIKDKFYGVLARTVEAVAPRFAVPFASSHYYRSEDSAPQNASLIDFDELERRTHHDGRFVVMRVGDKARFDAAGAHHTPRVPALAHARHVAHDHGSPVPWADLLRVVTERCLSLGHKFPTASWFVPELLVGIRDARRALALHVGSPPREIPYAAELDISVHSRALLDWHGRAFGDDTFFAGAHFTLHNQDMRAIHAWALITLLDASHLDARSLVSYVASRHGRRFLKNRREEIWATVTAGRVKAGQMRG